MWFRAPGCNAVVRGVHSLDVMPMRLLFVPTFALLSLAVGCVGDPVGAPCIPETVPEGGFVERETYVETSSPQCETRLCIARGVRGDPRPGCEGDGCTPEPEIREGIYCTVRCELESECPEGFTCAELSLQGRACVKDGP